jgi:hypothetical protein
MDKGLTSTICKEFKKLNNSWVPVPYICNDSYLGNRDQENCGSKPAK